MRTHLTHAGLLVILAAAILAGCHDEPRNDQSSAQITDCTRLPDGWEAATASTPDLVPPCNRGSQGTCPSTSHEYVRGTGYCRPKH